MTEQPKMKLFSLLWVLVLSALFIGASVLWGSSSAKAGNLEDAFMQLKEDYPEYLEDFRELGVSDEEIERFIQDLSNSLSSRNLTEENFNDELLKAAWQLRDKEEHENLISALFVQFSEEIEIILTGQLPSNLKPVRDVLKNALLDDEDNDKDEDNDSGSGGDTEKGNDGNSGGGTPGTGNSGNSDGVNSGAGNSEKPGEGSLGSDANNNFKDIEGHWAKSEIEMMATKNIVKGISENSFEPERAVTRAEFSALLVRALELDINSDQTINFSDVTPDKWYYKEILAAVSAGLVKGYTDTNFAPNDLITREQMAAMVSRSMKFKGKSGEFSQEEADGKLLRFADREDISEWAKNDVVWVLENQIVNGRTANTFVPKANATRAESTVIIKRFMDNI